MRFVSAQILHQNISVLKFVKQLMADQKLTQNSPFLLVLYVVVTMVGQQTGTETGAGLLVLPTRPLSTNLRAYLLYLRHCRTDEDCCLTSTLGWM